jgi:hypothetical protein
MTGRRRQLWADLGWPALAGLTTAAGLTSAYVSLGPATMLIVFGLTVVTVAVLAISLLDEHGTPTVAAIVRPALTVAGIMVVTMGLISWMQAWAFVVLAVVGASHVGVRRRVRRALAGSPPARAETRRRFDEIVAHLGGLEDDDDR